MTRDILKEKLKEVSKQLQDLAHTHIICEKLAKSNNIKIVEEGKIKEGEEPVTLALKGDIVANLLNPLANTIKQRKEGLLQQ